nr:FxSxx-COOH cyclophane-containing RiPP peptide [Microbispora cellulosiformans]
MGDMADGGYSGGLIDVTGLSLVELGQVDNPALSEALRRLLEEDGSVPYAGFQSTI